MAQGITIDANINLVKFAGQVDKMSERMDKFQAKTESVASHINSGLAAIGVGVSIAGMLAFAKSGIDAADALNDMADRTGIAVEKLAGFQLATKNADTNMEAFALAANKLSVNIGKNSAEFAKLGITAKDPADAFLQLADVFKAIENPQDRAAFGAKALGKSYAEMAPLLLQGGDALREQITLGQEMSGVTAESAKMAADFNDKLDTMGARSQGLRIKLSLGVLEPVVAISESLNAAIERGITFTNVLSGIANGMRQSAFGTGGGLTAELDNLNVKIAESKDKLRDARESGTQSRAGVNSAAITAEKELNGLIIERAFMLTKISDDRKKQTVAAPPLLAVKDFIGSGAGEDTGAKKLRAETSARQSANKALTDYNKQQERYQAMREGANTDVAFKSNIDEYSRAFNVGAISIQDYIFWLSKLDDVKNSAKPVEVKDTGWADVMAIQDEVAIDRANGAKSYLDKYNQSLDDTKNNVADLGSLTSAIFDGSLGGVNLMAGAFENLTQSILKTNEELERNREAQKINDAQPESDQKLKNAKLYADKEKELQNANIKSALTGVRQVASATAGMFKENTNARRAFNVVALAASVSERLADIAGLGIKAASAVLEQGKGDPYTAFARMAAMAAIVGSVLAAAGAGTFQFGGSGKATGKVPTSPDSGTVLGDASAQSESISKTYELLQDIHAREYRELRGINTGVAAMQKGITDSVTKLFQSGGLKDMNIQGLGSKLTGIGSFLSSQSLLGKLGFGGILDSILGGIFGKTKKEVTGGGIYTGSLSLAGLLKGREIDAQQYAEITTTKKSWFSKKTSIAEVMGDVDPGFKTALTQMFKGMATSMLSMATSFGVDLTGAVNKYVIPSIKVSLYGLTSEQMIKTLNNVLSTQLDLMTSRIFGKLIKKYQKLGEGLFETAGRLLVEKAIVMDALSLSGRSFTGDAIAMADGLAQLAGGIDKFKANFEDYYRKFYSESEQLANTTRRLTDSLKDMGAVLPATRQGYRDLVNAQKLDTVAGRERYDQLLYLSSAADTYYASMEKLRESMKLLTQDNFKTAVDYRRYLGLANLAGISGAAALLPANTNTTFMPTGLQNQMLPGVAPMSSAYTTVADSNNLVANEVKLLRLEQQAQAAAIAQNTADMAKIIKRWEGDGMPAVRVIA